jgi:diguanylate cyclase (GGDEF)-like protein
VGDEVLRRLGSVLRGRLRVVDLAARYGGEEFVLLLVETAPVHAAGLCEQLRAAVEGHAWGRIAPGLRLTISIGVACRDDTSTPASLLALADQRMYRAKRAGRNRVCG